MAWGWSPVGWKSETSRKSGISRSSLLDGAQSLHSDLRRSLTSRQSKVDGGLNGDGERHIQCGAEGKAEDEAEESSPVLSSPFSPAREGGNQKDKRAEDQDRDE